jgi:hypothetical protein
MMNEDEVQNTDDEVGCWIETDTGEEHHGIACDHPTCTDCGTVLVDVSDTCWNCGRKEAG